MSKQTRYTASDISVNQSYGAYGGCGSPVMRPQTTGQRQPLKSGCLRYALRVKGSLPNPAKSGCLRHAPPTGKQITNRLQRTQAAEKQTNAVKTTDDAQLLPRYLIAGTAEAVQMIWKRHVLQISPCRINKLFPGPDPVNQALLAGFSADKERDGKLPDYKHKHQRQRFPYGIVVFRNAHESR